jgi:hemerythrin-like domain-containing protein
MQQTDTSAVLETRLVHDTHRRATTLLVDAARRGHGSRSALTELRDFVVAVLDHHHESEDRVLWPLLADAAPHLADALGMLSIDHDQLAVELDALRSVALDGEVDMAALATRATTVRDHVHAHLAREEPVLFPALQNHITENEWSVFSQRTVASAPQEGLHLLAALFEEVGTPRQIDLILQHVPVDARGLFRAGAARGRATLAALPSVVSRITPSPSGAL